jgi:5-methylcytosine-specific restriction endonuclease McrA
MNWFLNFFRDYKLGVARSPKWSEVRKSHLASQNKCQVCLSKKKLEVHHVIPVNVDASKELDFSNLITLCRPCHLLFGHLGSWYSWNDDVRLDALAMRGKILRRP